MRDLGRRLIFRVYMSRAGATWRDRDNRERATLIASGSRLPISDLAWMMLGDSRLV